MKTTTITADQLTPQHIADWKALLALDPTLESPYFRPEFTQAIASVRDDVEVAVLESGGVTIGFFPFERRPGNIGRPVGGLISDFHGIVLHPHHTVDAMQLMHDCKLSAWHFENLLASQAAFTGFHWVQAPSPFIDISQGFDAYCAARKRAGSDTIKNTLRKLRKAERELGPVRLELNCTDQRVLQTLMDWKAEQYHESRLFNLFSCEWTRQLFTTLLAKTDDAFRGMMSALYLGDKLVAVHYGLRSKRILHGWVPAYSREFARVSPGSQLLLQMIRHAPANGVERIDMSWGDEKYKDSYTSAVTYVAKGSVDTRLAVRTVRRLWHYTHSRVRESPLRGPLTTPWRYVKRLVHQAQFR